MNATSRASSDATPSVHFHGHSSLRGWVSRAIAWLNPERQYLVTLLALALVLGVSYAAITPPLAGPDEAGHFDHAQLMWQTHGDRTTWASKPAPPNDERPQPDSYYWLAAAGYGVAADQPQPVQVVAVRLVSVVLLLGEVVLAFLTARLLAPTNRFVHLAAPSIVALLPGRVWMGAMINNDNLAALASAALIYLFVRCTLRGFERGSVVGLLIAVPVALASKTTAWPVVAITVAPLLVAAVVALWRSRLRGWQRILLAPAFLLVSALVAASPSRFQLDRALNTLATLRDKLAAMPAPQPEPFVHQWKSFWLPIVSDDFAAPDSAFQLALGFVALVAFGLAIRGAVGAFLAVRGRSLPFRQAACAGTLFLIAAAVWTVSFLMHVTVVSGTASFSVSRDIWPPTHARYLFPALLPVAYLMASGLGQLVPKRFGFVGLAAVSAFLLLLNGYAFYSLASHYYW